MVCVAPRARAQVLTPRAAAGALFSRNRAGIAAPARSPSREIARRVSYSTEVEQAVSVFRAEGRRGCADKKASSAGREAERSRLIPPPLPPHK